MRSDPSYPGSVTDDSGSARSESPVPDWFNQLDDARAIARRRFRLVGAAPGARILVVGCGRGDDVLALARLVRPGGRAFGVDQGEADLAEGRRRATAAGLAAKFHYGDPGDLPFPDASFDGVCSAWLFAGITDPALVLSEMVRAVHPGGRVVIDDTDWTNVTLEASHADTTERVLRHHAANHAPTTGHHRLDQLARTEGLIDLTTATTSIVDRTGSTLRLFAEMANAAAADGAVTAAESAHFKADLAQAVATKRFSAALTFVTLAGRRP